MSDQAVAAAKATKAAAVAAASAATEAARTAEQQKNAHWSRRSALGEVVAAPAAAPPDKPRAHRKPLPSSLPSSLPPSGGHRSSVHSAHRQFFDVGDLTAPAAAPAAAPNAAQRVAEENRLERQAAERVVAESKAAKELLLQEQRRGVELLELEHANSLKVAAILTNPRPHPHDAP